MSSTGPAGAGSLGGSPKKGFGVGSQLHGHLQYAKGAIQETLGKVTGATGLQSTGKGQQTSALTGMRNAKENIHPQNAPPVSSTSNSDTTVVAGGHRDGAYSNVDAGTREGAQQPITGSAGMMSMGGKAEKTLGSMVGCKGMQHEGAQKVAGAEALRRSQARGGGSGGVERSGLGEDA